MIIGVCCSGGLRRPSTAQIKWCVTDIASGGSASPKTMEILAEGAKYQAAKPQLLPTR
jgi:hypothetical protein